MKTLLVVFAVVLALVSANAIIETTTVHQAFACATSDC
jgi:hypothetical protein